MMSSPRLHQILAHDIDDPAKYALTEPDMTVAVIVRRGGANAIEFRIGNRTPDGEHHYVNVVQGSSTNEDTNRYGALNSRIDAIIALATRPNLKLTSCCFLRVSGEGRRVP